MVQALDTRWKWWVPSIDAAALHIPNIRGKPQTVFQQWAMEMLNN